MTIYLGADHRGFELKEKLKVFLGESGYKIVDVGAHSYDKDDDYPDFAAKVADAISNSKEKSMGILLCGSGVGMDVAANKFSGVRATLAYSELQIKAARNDDDVNIISIGADFINEDDAKKIVTVFLETPFAKEERFVRRLQKIAALEAK